MRERLAQIISDLTGQPVEIDIRILNQAVDEQGLGPLAVFDGLFKAAQFGAGPAQPGA